MMLDASVQETYDLAELVARTTRGAAGEAGEADQPSN